jgi:hypothetical protein
VGTKSIIEAYFLAALSLDWAAFILRTINCTLNTKQVAATGIKI